MQEDKAGLSNSVQSLVDCLEITMMQHPLLALRNMAFWSLDALLNALQVLHSYTAHEQPHFQIAALTQNKISGTCSHLQHTVNSNMWALGHTYVCRCLCILYSMAELTYLLL